MSIEGQRAGECAAPCVARGYRAGVFAGALMIVSGIGAVFEGVAAVFNDKVFVSMRNISTRST